MFEDLEEINRRPGPFEFYDAKDLWTEDHRSKQLLSLHLNEEIDVASRNVDFINTIVELNGIRSFCNWLQYFSPEDLEVQISRYGFTMEEKYSDVAGTPFSPGSDEFAVVITKA